MTFRKLTKRGKFEKIQMRQKECQIKCNRNINLTEKSPHILTSTNHVGRRVSMDAKDVNSLQNAYLNAF